MHPYISTVQEEVLPTALQIHSSASSYISSDKNDEDEDEDEDENKDEDEDEDKDEEVRVDDKPKEDEVGDVASDGIGTPDADDDDCVVRAEEE